MNIEKYLFSAALILVSIIIAITVSSNFSQYLSTRTQQLRNDAVNGCMQVSGVYEYTNPKDGVKSATPQKEIYNICMTDKGYASSWK